MFPGERVDAVTKCRYHKPLIPLFEEVGALLCVRTTAGIVGVAKPNDMASLPSQV